MSTSDDLLARLDKRVANTGTEHPEAASLIRTQAARIAELESWVDNNMTFYDVAEGRNIPTLGQVSKRIWYHATDDVASYPFSAVIRKALRAAEKEGG